MLWNKSQGRANMAKTKPFTISLTLSEEVYLGFANGWDPWQESLATALIEEATRNGVTPEVKNLEMIGQKTTYPGYLVFYTDSSD